MAIPKLYRKFLPQAKHSGLVLLEKVVQPGIYHYLVDEGKRVVLFKTDLGTFAPRTPCVPGLPPTDLMGHWNNEVWDDRPHVVTMSTEALHAEAQSRKAHCEAMKCSIHKHEMIIANQIVVNPNLLMPLLVQPAVVRLWIHTVGTNKMLIDYGKDIYALIFGFTH